MESKSNGTNSSNEDFFKLAKQQKANWDQLLDRSPLPIFTDEVSGYLRDKVVLVTGAGGSIGSELCRQIARNAPKQLLLLGHGEHSIYMIEKELRDKHHQLQIESIIADIQDATRLEDVFSFYRPQVIFHTAAHKHVHFMELNPSEAIKNNVLGTRNVAECANRYEAERLIFISSDKAVNPTNVLGVTKRLAEHVLQSMEQNNKTRFVIVRFGNVLGSSGSVALLFMEQIMKGGPITITHPEMTRYFMTIPEAVHLVIQAGEMAKGREIFILHMGKPVKIVDLAYKLIKLAGLKPDKDIQIVYSGIRPGEKLFEELFTDNEKIRVTKHSLLFVCDPPEFSDYHLQDLMDQLEAIVSKQHSIASVNEIISRVKSMIDEP
jgi:FlaA1/EpsC-like NDP-sugar epimerase